jgi:hypothetical protein
LELQEGWARRIGKSNLGTVEDAVGGMLTEIAVED